MILPKYLYLPFKWITALALLDIAFLFGFNIWGAVGSIPLVLLLVVLCILCLIQLILLFFFTNHIKVQLIISSLTIILDIVLGITLISDFSALWSLLLVAIICSLISITLSQKIFIIAP
ncbi:hypothetical protein ACVQ8P_03785 [Dellaglioa sp. BT-FLS60]